MKANIPKSWEQLPTREKEAIKKLITETTNQIIVKEEAELQKIWLQYACIVLHDAFGFGESRLLQFLGNWRRMYRKNAKFSSEAEQKAWIDERINPVFKNGYPYEFIDTLEDIK